MAPAFREISSLKVWLSFQLSKCSWQLSSWQQLHNSVNNNNKRKYNNKRHRKRYL